MKPDAKRRGMILATAALLLAGPARASRLLQPTPRQSTGPFYPVEPPLDDDNDLTRVVGRSGVARGQITDLSGRLVDLNGRPLHDVRIEIWQCDANGRYRHPRDTRRRPVDENFQGFGHAVTDSEGRYRFRTIRPVPYPGRTPHIHVAVLGWDAEPFVTQLYVRDEPRNAEDFLFNRLPPERRHLVLADFVSAPDRTAQLTARFDIVLSTADGTPAA